MLLGGFCQAAFAACSWSLRTAEELAHVPSAYLTLSPGRQGVFLSALGQHGVAASQPELFLTPTEETLPKAKLSPPGEAPEFPRWAQPRGVLRLSPSRQQVAGKDRCAGLHGNLEIALIFLLCLHRGSKESPSYCAHTVGILFGSPQCAVLPAWSLAAPGLPEPAWLLVHPGLCPYTPSSERFCLTWAVGCGLSRV